MKSNKKISRIIGVLFLLPIIIYGTGDGLITSIWDEQNYLASLANNDIQLIFGGILLLTNSIIVAILGVILFPIIKQINHYIALGYLSTRLIEAIVLIVGVISLWSLIPLGEEYLKMEASDPSYFQALSIFAVKAQYYAYQVAMMILGLGSVVFCYALYESKLIPQGLSIWGIVGYALLFLGALLEIFGHEVGIMMSIPGGLFELFLGGWLIFKGFNDFD